MKNILKKYWIPIAIVFALILFSIRKKVAPAIATLSTAVKPNHATVPMPSKYQRESANLNQWYQSEHKFRLLANTHGDQVDQYYYAIFDSEGRIVLENFGARPKIPAGDLINYQGDHSNEFQLALKDGTYKLLVINRHENDLLFGVISASEYWQYRPGGLQYSDWYARLKKGESVTKTFDWKETLNKKELFVGGFNKLPSYIIKNPFYKDGVIYIERMRTVGSPNGAEVTQEGNTTLKYFSAIDPSLNISIEYEGAGVGKSPRYRVVEKNGLDVDPNTFNVSPFYNSFVKLFAKSANTFPDSPDYVAPAEA